MSIHTFFSLITFIGVLILGTFVLTLNKYKRLNKKFVVLCISLACYCFCEFMQRQAIDLQTAYFWKKCMSFWPFVGIFMVQFFLVFTEREQAFSRFIRHVIIYFPGLMISIFALTTDLLVGDCKKMDWGYVFILKEYNWLFVFITAWLSFLFLLITYITIVYFIKLKDKKTRVNARFVLIGYFIMVIGGIIEVLLIRFDLNISGTILPGILIFCGFITYAIWRYQLFTIDPAAITTNIISAMPEGLFVAKVSGEMIMANVSLFKLLNYNKKDLINRSIDKLFAHHHSKKLIMTSLLRDGILTNYDTEYKTKSGKKLNISFSGSAIRNKHNQIIGVIGIARDMTEYKSMLEASEFQHNLGIVLGVISSFDDTIKLFLGTAIHISEMDLGCIYWIDKDNLKMKLAYHKGFNGEDVFKKKCVVDKTKVLKLLSDGPPVYTNYNAIASKRRRIKKNEIKAVGLFPVYHEGELAACLLVGSHKKDSIKDSVKSSIEILASQIGGAVARVKTELALKKSEEKYRVLIENSGLEIIEVDKKGNILFLNTKAEKTLGEKRKSLKGKNLADVFPGSIGADLVKDVKKVISTKKTISKEIIIETSSDDRYFFVNIKMNDWPDGKDINIQILCQDITEQRKIEKDKMRFQDHLIQSEKMISLGRLAGGVAHEINNPLTSILGFSQLMQKDVPSSSSQYEELKIIEKSVLRCKDIVQSLLIYSRFDDYSFNNVNINDVINNTLTLIGYQLMLKKIKITKCLAENLPAISGNQQKLEQVIINMIYNAKDSMPDGGDLIISTRATKGRVSIIFKDTGVGIPSHIRNHIFDPFFTSKPPGKGTGLGLSICVGIIKKHKGEIHVEHTSKKGTSFVVLIPIAKRSKR